MKEQMISMFPTDDVAANPILEVKVAENWVPADKDIWDAWTGLRRINGEDHHGPVHPISHPDRVWTGSRVCGCKTCQVNVAPAHRPN